MASDLPRERCYSFSESAKHQPDCRVRGRFGFFHTIPHLHHEPGCTGLSKYRGKDAPAPSHNDGQVYHVSDIARTV